MGIDRIVPLKTQLRDNVGQCSQSAYSAQAGVTVVHLHFQPRKLVSSNFLRFFRVCVKRPECHRVKVAIYNARTNSPLTACHCKRKSEIC